MGQIENFYHEHKSLPVLVKAALIHVQFETIHPFLDGNGRLGRLLITLMLVADGVLVEPLLYLSLYFKKHRTRYYDLLQKVRFEGNWEEWLMFFFTAVLERHNRQSRRRMRFCGFFNEITPGLRS